MTLPASGLISLSDIAVELGKSSTTPITLNDSDVRALAGKPTGTVTLPNDFWGKSSDTIVVTITPSSNHTTSSTVTFGRSSYTVSVTKGGITTTPTAFLWSVVAITLGSGTARVFSGGTTATASLEVDSPYDTQTTEAQFQCQVTVDGQSYTQTCYKSHRYTGNIN